MAPGGTLAGFRLVLASSGKREHVEHYLDLLDARQLAQAWTSADDVAKSKPAPDLFEVALDKVGGGSAVTVGDAIWDFRAADRLGIPGIAVRTGGFCPAELSEAGAGLVYDSLPELTEHLDDTALRAADRPVRT